MSNSQKGTDLVYKGSMIHRDPKSGLVCLTDMWKAQGCPEEKRPNDWVNLPQTRDLIRVLTQNTELSGIYKTRRGKGGGSYAVPDLAIAYAEYLSAEFHAWALNAVKERIEEEASPELAYNRGRERAVKGWKRQGKSDDWIQDRVNGIENYKQHTAVLQAHGVKPGKVNGFALCADAINEKVLGCRSKKAKVILGITKKSEGVRDRLSRLQLTALSFAEAMADGDIEVNSIHGNFPCRDVCSKAAERVAAAAKGSTLIQSA
jgi:hypothetical protein